MADFPAVNASAAKMAMMAITTSNSIRVKARNADFRGKAGRAEFSGGSFKTTKL